jgi:putative endonuclease
MQSIDNLMQNSWLVYILRCSDSTLYTGITTDILRRIDEHNGNDKLAARYTRCRRPVALVYSEACDTRSAASQREYAIKQLKRSDKELLISAKGLLKKS